MQNFLSLPSELCDMWQYQCQLFEFFPIGFLPGHVPAAKQSVGQLFGKGKEHLSDFMFISKVQQKNLVDQCNNIGLKIPINNLMDFYYPVFAKDPTLRVPRKEFNQLLLNFVMDFSQNKDLAYCLPVFFPSRLALFRQNSDMRCHSKSLRPQLWRMFWLADLLLLFAATMRMLSC